MNLQMTKIRMENNRGISLTSLAITITVILIMTSVIIYNLRDNIKLEKFKNLENDIENLRDKISIYYAQYGAIPAKGEYTNVGYIDSISDVVDTGKFLVIDLSALDNLTLNYGRDYENVKALTEFKTSTTLTSEQMQNNVDLYIINEDSHNIFLVSGIELNGKTYYTDYSSKEKDVEAVKLYVSGVS